MDARPLIIGSLFAAAAALPAAVAGSGDNLPHFQLNWSDEFNQGYANTGYPANNAPDPSVWNKDAFGLSTWYKGQINATNGAADYERQVFMGRPENLRVEGGNLILELRADSAQGVGWTDRTGKVNDIHTSSIMELRKDAGSAKPSLYRNSRIEFRAKIPHQPQVWPALWACGITGGWPGNGEFDILEYWGVPLTTDEFGYNSTNNVHWANATGGHAEDMQAFQMRRPSDAFHIYAMEKDQEKVLMFYDDVLISWRSITAPEQSELRDLDLAPIINFCYTGDDPAMDRIQMQVDYIREYLFKAGERRHYPPSVAVGTNWATGVSLNAFTNQPFPITGSVSGDGMPGAGYTYEWQQTSGPGAGVFADATALQTTVTFPVAGTYRIRLIAHDGQYGNSGWRQIIVVDGSGNTAPIAASPDRTVLAGYPVKLKATVVDDGLPGGGNTVSWGMWGTPPVTFSSTTDAEPTVTFAWAGDYVLTLTASDGALTGNETLVRIKVVDGTNQAPVVATGAPLNINLGDTITLPGTVSDDGLPEYNTTQQWTRISGPAPVMFAHQDWVHSTATFTAGGTYVLRLTATDQALSASADLTVNVSMTGNNVPVISTADPVALVCNEGASATVALAASDADSDPLTWSVITPAGHGTAAVNASGLVSYTPTAGYVGADSCVVQVADGRGGADTITINISVTTTRPNVSGLTANPNHVATVGDTVALMASVTPGTGHSIDHVAFSAGGIALGNGVFSGGTWNLNYTTTTPGATLITVTAYGDDNQTSTRTVVVTAVTSGTFGNGGAPWQVPATGTCRLEVENFDLGGEGVAYHDDNQRQGTNASRATENVDLETLTPSGIDIGYTAAGEWLRYSLNVAATGTYDLRFHVANGTGATSAGAFTLLWKGTSVAGPVSVPATGDWGVYTDVVVSGVTLAGGAGLLEFDCNTGGFNIDWIEFTATAVGANAAPTVNAGADQSITLPATATISGSATDDGLPAGSSLSYLWTKSSGPGTVTFGSTTSAGTTASFSVAGTYVLQLAASDTALSGTDTVTIIVNAAGTPNTAPVANAGADQSITLPATATLSGSATDDGLPAGSTLTYLWSKSSGLGTVTFGSSTSAGTTASFSVAGTYVLQLAASDTALSGTDTVTIIVNAAGTPNTAPVANAGADQTITLPATATLSGSATDDGLPAGSALTYLWSKSSGLGTVTFGSSTSAGTTASFSVAGTYVLLFAASDSALSGTDTVTITVNGTASGGGPVTVAPGGSAGGSCGAGGALGLLIASLGLLGLRRRSPPV